MSPSPSRWMPTALTGEVVALYAGGDAAYAALADGRVLVSADGGTRWTDVHGAAPGHADAPSTLLAVPGALLLALPHTLVRLDADGTAHEARGLPDGDDVVALVQSDAFVVAGTLRCGVYRSSDDGAHWAPASHGLPFGGRGLHVSGFAQTGEGLFAAHPLGVSRSRDGGGAWEPAGFGLPLQMRHVSVVASGAHVFAEADGRLFRLAGGRWTEQSDGAVSLLGADASRLYGLDAASGLVQIPTTGGAWRPYGEGLPHAPAGLAFGDAWRMAALGADGVWRRSDAPAIADDSPAPALRLDHVPQVLTGAPASVTFWLAAPGHAVLSLVDVAGADVLRLVDAPLAAGSHAAALDAAPLLPGWYQCRLTAAGQRVARPVAVVHVTALPT